MVKDIENDPIDSQSLLPPMHIHRGFVGLDTCNVPITLESIFALTYMYNLLTSFQKFIYIGPQGLKSSLKKQLYIKELRTNIGLADTLIPSLFIYLIYMGGSGPYDSIKIIFGNYVNS